MKIQKSILIMFLLLFSIAVTFAQNARTYSGKISDENGIPVVGAVVSGDEGKTQVITNENGQFTIQVSSGDKLLVEAEGFDPKLIDAGKSATIVMGKPIFLTGEINKISVPFATIEKRKTTGAVTEIVVDKEMEFDQRLTVNSALDGKVPGLFGDNDIWGRGAAVVVIDGIARASGNYNLNEIESVTVLKDPVSRIMYGAKADQGVILIKTKRGKANKRILDFRGETGISTPKAFPSFLGSAGYMKAYNQGLVNDGGLPKYSTEMINKAGSGPLFPDEDFYSGTYLKNYTCDFNFNGTASGGNESTQYFVNMGWVSNSGWYEPGEADNRNQLNLRGNVDFKVTNSLSMKLDAVAVLDFVKTPNVDDFWGRAASTVPNAYPALWDPSLITDQATREEVLGKAKLLNGKLLGGNKTYRNNMYGDFIRGGNRTQLNRFMQFNTGLDWDLNFITPGLKASGYLTFDFFNTLSTYQDSKYAVYNPVPADDGSVGVEIIGEDKSVSNYSTEAATALFTRSVGLFGTLSYEKKTGNHEISAVGLAYRDQMFIRDMEQDAKNLHFGLNANYVYKGRYLADVAAVVVGSQKLKPGDNYAVSPAIGLGWILTDEEFMDDNKIIDYLKLRANYGILKNDNWDNYFLYETAYMLGKNFYYNNENASNEELNYVTRASNIGWQSRKEFVIGADAALFNKDVWIEASWFNSKSVNQITEMNYTYPTLMGSIPFFSNYNSTLEQGFDLGIRYTKKTGNWKITLGSNLVYSVPEILKAEEPNYDEAHSYLNKTGTATDAIWGLEATGLYPESDFTVIDYENQVFKLNDNLPVSTFGKVQPGDIKYTDQDGNGIIDNEDLVVIGNYKARVQYSLYLKLKFKRFELFALGIGKFGGYNMRSGDYYRFYGELKYPSFASDAYGQGNKNTNSAYPRISSTRNNHNFLSSTFWLFQSNWVKIPALQLSYNITSKNVSGILKDARVFVRSADLVTFSKNKGITDLNVDSAPQTRSFSIGFVSKF